MASYISGLESFCIITSYIVVSLITAGVLGWIIYSKLVLRTKSLKEVLFNEDNLSIWLDAAGSFAIPILFLVSTILTPSGKFTFYSSWVDYINIILYIILYLCIFTFFRLTAELFIYYFSKFQLHEKISINKEIYNEKNIAASILNISISVIATNLLLNERFLVESFSTNFIRLLIILVLSMGFLSIYKSFFFPTNSSLFKETFVDNNPCSAILFLGQAVSASLIIDKVIDFLKISYNGWLNFGYIIDFVLFTTSIYVLMLLIVKVIKAILNFVLKVNINKELYKQNNIGYSFTESGFYVVLSLIIISTFLS